MWIQLLIGLALCLVSCQFQGRAGRGSLATAGRHTVDPSAPLDTRPLAVIISGFKAPGTLYQAFELQARQRGMETLVVEVPAAGTSLFRQDLALVSALEEIAAKLAPEVLAGHASQRHRELYLFGHSLGGKLVTLIALLDSEQPEDKVTRQIGGYARLQKAHMREVQRSLRGVFLLDPVYEGVDTYLMKRLQLESGAEEGSPMQSTLRRLDSTMVSLPVEELRPRADAKPGFKVSIVQAALGNRGKSAVELAETAQALRRDLGAVTSLLKTPETWLAHHIRHEAPPCGPDFVSSDGWSIPGYRLAHGLFAHRMAVLDLAAAARAQHLTKDGVTQTLPNEGLVQVHTIVDAGHMDVVDVQPYQHASHQKFVRLCAMGPALRQALAAGRPKSDAQVLRNPYHEQAVALWRDFLGQ